MQSVHPIHLSSSIIAISLGLLTPWLSFNGLYSTFNRCAIFNMPDLPPGGTLIDICLTFYNCTSIWLTSREITLTTLSLWQDRIYFFGHIIKHVEIIIGLEDKCIDEGDFYLKYNDDKLRH